MDIRWIYIMANFPKIWIIKIGISNNIRKRRKDISETTWGLVFPIWAVIIPFAKNTEQTLHNLFSRFNIPLKRGSGKSEWFMILPTLPLAWLIINFMFALWWLPIWIFIGWIYLTHI